MPFVKLEPLAKEGSSFSGDGPFRRGAEQQLRLTTSTSE